MRTKKTGDRKTGLAAAVLFAAIAGCGGDDDGMQVEEPVPTTVEISPESATLASINATQGFTAVVRDQNGKAMSTAAVSWSGSDEAVFTVSASGSNATVVAVGNGSATLTASSGQASGTASVVVAQVPAKLAMVSGDEQEGLRGTMLPEALVVRVEDEGGTAAAGVSVTFLPDEGSGSVSESMVETDADGMASTEWTLGVDRMQSLVAFVGDAAVRFSATATADPPMPDLILSSYSFSRTEATIYEAVDIEVVITNGGDGAGPATFPVRVTAAAEPIETADVAAIAPGASATVAFTIGPFEEGTHRIGLALDPDDEIEEWAEDNNSASEPVVVVDQQAISPGESVELSSPSEDTVFLFRVEIDEASDEALNVELSGGDGDADLLVHYADRPNHIYRYLCASLSPETAEKCQMVPTRKGVYHVAVHAWSAFGPTTLEVTLGGQPVEDYNIDLVFVEGGTSSQHDIVRKAAERWESVIVQGARDVDFSANPNPPDPCGPGSQVATGIVDDLQIYITIDSIDGAGGSGGNSVAESNLCFVRGYSTTPEVWEETITGYIHLDEHDAGEMAQGVLQSVVMHEIAHVLGFHPVVLNAHGHLKDPSLPSTPEADTHFDGYLSIAAFDAAGGTGYEGAKVPVENGGVLGSSDQHWRQSVFGDELMTPLLTGTSQPLSLITIELFADLGYGVDLSQAESFSLSSAGGAGMALPRGPVIDLSNDIGRGPIELYDMNMKTGSVRIIHRSR